MTINPHPSPSCSSDCYTCKVASVSFPSPSGPAFKPHYNYSVGSYVSTDREFRDKLKMCSDRNSEATGIDHNYEPRYGSDLQPIREADNVLDTRARNITQLTGNLSSYD